MPPPENIDDLLYGIDQAVADGGGEFPNAETVKSLLDKFGRERVWRQAQMLKARIEQAKSIIHRPTALWVKCVEADDPPPRWPYPSYEEWIDRLNAGEIGLAGLPPMIEQRFVRESQARAYTAA